MVPPYASSFLRESGTKEVILRVVPRYRVLRMGHAGRRLMSPYWTSHWWTIDYRANSSPRSADMHSQVPG